MTERYERTKPAVVQVQAPAGETICNKKRATVRLELLGDRWFLTVRPYRFSRVYRLPLTKVADMVCYSITKAEVEEERQRKGLRTLNRRTWSRAFFGR